MSAVKSLGKYVLYYAASYILVSIFVHEIARQPLMLLIGAALAVAFFATAFRLLLGGAGGPLLNNVATWCVRGAFAAAIIAAMASFAFSNLTKFFT